MEKGSIYITLQLTMLFNLNLLTAESKGLPADPDAPHIVSGPGKIVDISGKTNAMNKKEMDDILHELWKKFGKNNDAGTRVSDEEKAVNVAKSAAEVANQPKKDEIIGQNIKKDTETEKKEDRKLALRELEKTIDKLIVKLSSDNRDHIETEEINKGINDITKFGEANHAAKDLESELDQLEKLHVHTQPSHDDNQKKKEVLTLISNLYSVLESTKTETQKKVPIHSVNNDTAQHTSHEKSKGEDHVVIIHSTGSGKDNQVVRVGPNGIGKDNPKRSALKSPDKRGVISSKFMPPKQPAHDRLSNRLSPIGKRDEGPSLAPIGKRDEGPSLAPIGKRDEGPSLAPIGKRDEGPSLAPIGKKEIASGPIIAIPPVLGRKDTQVPNVEKKSEGSNKSQDFVTINKDSVKPKVHPLIINPGKKDIEDKSNRKIYTPFEKLVLVMIRCFNYLSGESVFYYDSDEGKVRRAESYRSSGDERISNIADKVENIKFTLVSVFNLVNGNVEFQYDLKNHKLAKPRNSFDTIDELVEELDIVRGSYHDKKQFDASTKKNVASDPEPLIPPIGGRSAMKKEVPLDNQILRIPPSGGRRSVVKRDAQPSSFTSQLLRIPIIGKKDNALFMKKNAKNGQDKNKLNLKNKIEKIVSTLVSCFNYLSGSRVFFYDNEIKKVKRGNAQSAGAKSSNLSKKVENVKFTLVSLLNLVNGDVMFQYDKSRKGLVKPENGFDTIEDLVTKIRIDDKSSTPKPQGNTSKKELSDSDEIKELEKRLVNLIQDIAKQ